MQKDAAGPIHSVEVLPTDIDGVFLERYPSVDYQYGTLVEVMNQRWADGMHQRLDVRHLYFVVNDGSLAREEWYVHNECTDRYVLIQGRLSVALYDDRQHSPTFGRLFTIKIGAIGSELSNGLSIPPGVWHSFNPTDGAMVLCNAKSPGYNRSEPDKYRIPMPNEATNFTWN